MSKDEKVAEPKFGLTRRIMEILKITDSGVIDSFLTRVTKSCQEEIEAREHNLKTLELNHKRKLNGLEDKLEDSQEDLARVYTDVVPEKVKSNADAKAFVSKYLSNLDAAEEKVDGIETEIETEIEDYNKTKEVIENEIKALKLRIKNVKK